VKHFSDSFVDEDKRCLSMLICVFCYFVFVVCLCVFYPLILVSPNNGILDDGVTMWPIRWVLKWCWCWIHVRVLVSKVVFVVWKPSGISYWW